jgi:hypothetical protein
MTMTHEHKLTELGYETSPEGIRRFQQDHNRRRTARPLAVSGRLDDATKAAIDFTFPARHVLALLREGGG